MKKIYFGLIIALVLCSCTKTELTGIEAGEMIIGASMEVYPSISKAALSDTDGSLTWQTGDVIEVATSDGHATFNLKTGAGTASATFSANYSGTLSSYATYPADIFVSESKITIPTSREWSEGNTNCSMFGSVDGDNVAFKHLGGVVKVTLNGVPANAKKFVFSTPGKKITGEFDFKNDTDNIKYIETADDSGNANSSYTLSFNLSEAKNMAFYIPLPRGTYPKFAFKLLGDDDTANPLYEFEGISVQTVGRKDILIMPAATISEIQGGGDGDFLKSVPSETNGDYTLPAAESVILYFEGKQNPSTEDEIKLKYADGSQLPKKLCLKVKDGNKVNVSGDLPDTHVEFDQGEIVTASLRTSATTFKIIAPAKISEKLVVKGGNVEITGGISGGDNVKAIEVAAEATADGSSAPVQITIADNATIGTSGTGGENGGITTSANVVIVNNTTQEVNVTVPENVQDTVQVASAGTGSEKVKKDGEKVTTKPAAAIGTQNFFTLSEAINSVSEGNDRIVTIDILNDIVLKASDALTINKNNVVIDGKSHTITLDETDANLDKYKEDGDNKKYGSFQMIKVTGNDVVLRNLTLDSKEYRGVSLATTWGGRNATYHKIVYKGKGSGHYYVYAASEGTLAFIECTFNTCGCAIHTAESTIDLVVTDCNIDGLVSYGDKTKSASFTNCQFYKAEDKHNGTLATVRPYCSTTFTGCSFSSDYLTDSQYTGITVRSNVVVSLKECTVDGGKNLYELANITNPDDPWVDGGVLAINATGDATTGFTDGTFVAKKAADIKVAPSYRANAVEGKNNVYTVSVIPPAAKVGDTEYATLQEAFDAARAAMGGTITLLSDVVLAKTITWNGADDSKMAHGDGTVTDCSNKYTFDLNGYHVTPKEGTSCNIQVKGCEFNIKDSRGGGYLSNPNGHGFGFNAEREPYLDNCGVLNIYGGEFIGKNNDPCTQFNHSYGIGSGGQTNDGYVCAKIMNIYDGEFQGLSCDIARVNIRGGHFTSYIYKGSRDDTNEYKYDKENDAIFIYGGKFDVKGIKLAKEGSFDVIDITNDYLHIYAGDFNFNPSACVEEGSSVEQVGDRWIVTQNN